MPWRPLHSGLAFAICAYPFQATHVDDLPLQIGDQLYIIEQGGRDNEWYRGYLLSPPSLLSGLTSDRGQQLEHRVFTGIFPRNCVEVRELVGDGIVNGQAAESAVQGHDGAQDTDVDGEYGNGPTLLAPRAGRVLSSRISARDLGKKAKRPLPAPSSNLEREENAPRPLAPVPLLRVGDETGESAEEPLVDEIASCLREWHDARLHEILLARGYSQLADVQALIKRVDTSRKQLMHDVMTSKELDTLREDTVWDLVAGNKLLEDEVIVRSPSEKGRILTSNDSVIEMTRLQANMSILDRPPKPSPDPQLLHHILIDLRNLVYADANPGSIQIALFVKEGGEKPKPITESYAINVPLRDTASDLAAELPRTVFTDLSAVDIGVGGSTTKLYAVVRLVTDEPVRKGPPPQMPNGVETRDSIASLRNRVTLKDRRSILGSQRKPEGHSRAGSELTNRPNSARSRRSDTDGKDGSPAPHRPASDTSTAKRMVGIGAVDLSKLTTGQTELESRVTLWCPCSGEDDGTKDSTDWDDIIHELAVSSGGGFRRVGLMKRLDAFAAAFVSADIDTLVRNSPVLLHNVHHTQKLGFSGAPKKPRSDIYLTLSGPVLSQSPCLQHPRYGNVPVQQHCQTALSNLQLTMEVRKADGKRVEGCVYAAANNQAHTAWRTTAIERGEEWSQTIKLAIPPADVPGSHIVMSLADSPNFPFALCWLPLWENEAFVRDGDHQAALYVYDEYSSSMVAGRGAYLNLPPWHQKELEPTYGTSAIVNVRTYLCSTHYSQDPNLLGLLSWRNYHGEQLLGLLDRFSFVPEIEVVKLLSDVFQALFEILHEYANSEAYEDAVFYNFVIIMTIARDRRFNLTNIIEQYAATVHDWQYASRCLLTAFYRLLTNPLDSNVSRRLRATLKVGDQMLRLIIETRKTPQEAAHGVDKGVPQERYDYFGQDLQNLFVAVMALLRNPMPVLVGTQTLIVQNFHSWLPELEAALWPSEIMEIVTNLVDACADAQGKLVLHRLILVLNISQLAMFGDPETRAVLVTNTFRWLAPYWGEVYEVNEQWYSQVRLCCSVVATQMEKLGEPGCQYVPKLVESYAVLEKTPRQAKKVFSMLFPSTIPFPTRATPSTFEVDEAKLEISALLASALTSGQRLYFDANEVDVPGILMQALKVCQSILDGEAFPRSWMSLHVSHHRYAVSALERIAEVLIDWLPDSYVPDAAEASEFDTQIWRAFFDTLFAAVGSPSLAMETFPEQKRRAVWKIAGDVRELGAILIRRAWIAIGWETDAETKALHGFDRLGGYQVQFVPDLIPPIVELCLSVHANLRSVAVEVLRSMIISTWEIDEDLAMIQSTTINCLDKICRTRQMTESMLQKAFIDEMVAQFASLQNSVEDSLYNAVVVMFGRIEELLGMLATVHSGGTINEVNKIMDTLSLMQFFRDVQSDDAYIRYIHQLADLQVAAGNFTEAGLALKLHADRYDWAPAVLLPAIAEPPMPAQAAFDRKEALYFEICKNLEMGQAWPPALAAYKELAYQYETTSFDFAKLARTQRAMAAIHEKIAAGERPMPRYFRVILRGLGFPLGQRDKAFIFEGLPNDRLATFEERLQQIYPAIHILRGTQEPEVEGQFANVFTVSPNRDLEHMVYQRTMVSRAARDYSLLANPRKFTTSTRTLQPDVPITEQVVEKIVYTTADAFPNILRRSEIVEVQRVTMTPTQAAVERTTRKTQELLELTKKASAGDEEGAMSRLTEDLLLSVDPNSDSSVARYRNLLPVSEQPDTVSQEVDYEELAEAGEITLTPMQSALKVALLDHALAIRRCLALYGRSQYIATRAELLPRFEATFALELATLFPDGNIVIDDPSPRISLSGLQQAPNDASELAAGNGAPAEDEGEGQKRRGSRRRSFPFLRRRSSSRREANGVESDAGGDARGRSSRQSSRAPSRDISIGKRLSLFGGSEPSSRDGASVPNGRSTPDPQTSLLSAGARPSRASSKTRFSFLRGGD